MVSSTTHVDWAKLPYKKQRAITTSPYSDEGVCRLTSLVCLESIQAANVRKHLGCGRGHEVRSRHWLRGCRRNISAGYDWTRLVKQRLAWDMDCCEWLRVYQTHLLIERFLRACVMSFPYTCRSSCLPFLVFRCCESRTRPRTWSIPRGRAIASDESTDGIETTLETTSRDFG